MPARLPRKKISIQVHSNNQHGPRKVFNDNDAQYMCCHGKYHLRKAAVMVAGLELAAVCLTIVYSLVAYFQNGFMQKTDMSTDPEFRRKSLLILSLAMSIIAAIVWIISISLMVWGIKKSKPSFVIPHLMLQVVAIVTLAGLSALFVWWVINANDDSNKNNRISKRNGLVTTVLYSILASATMLAFFVEIFFFFVVHRCYKYLCTKLNYMKQRKVSQTKRNNR